MSCLSRNRLVNSYRDHHFPLLTGSESGSRHILLLLKAVSSGANLFGRSGRVAEYAAKLSFYLMDTTAWKRTTHRQIISERPRTLDGLSWHWVQIISQLIAICVRIKAINRF